MISIRLSNVSKYFGKKLALRGVSAEIEGGTFFCILGEPGAGKTTLLRIIAGLEIPDEGEVFFDGQEVTLLPPQKRNIAMVFQDFALYPHMSVFENIASPLRVKGLSEEVIREKVLQVAKFLKIDALLDRLPDYISGGERQRVAICRALVKEPSVCLFDEPLVNLDFKIREEMRVQFKLMQREFRQTLVYATPDPVDALSMADVLLVLHEGKVQQLGNVWEAYYHPANVFVATYLGFPAMNIVRGFLEMEKGSVLWKGSSLQLDLSSWGNFSRLEEKDREIFLGIRPENIVLGNVEGRNFTFEGKAVLSEVVGSDTIVHIEIGDLTLRSFVPGVFRVSPGEKLPFGFSIEDVYLFSASTGENLEFIVKGER